MALDKVVAAVKSLHHKMIIFGVKGTIFRLILGHGVVTVRAVPNGSRIMYCKA